MRQNVIQIELSPPESIRKSEMQSRRTSNREEDNKELGKYVMSPADVS